MTREIEESPIESAFQDDLHLNRDNAIQMANRIEREVERVMKEEREKREELIHQQGRKEGTDEAKKKTGHPREEKKGILCKFFSNGKCFRGESCYYKHVLARSSRQEGTASERS